MAPTRSAMGLNVSAGLELESGAPLTAFAAHPIYDGGGEIPLTARGAGFRDVRRLPHANAVDEAGRAQARRTTSKSAAGTCCCIADVFNVFNTQTVLDYDSLLRAAVQRAEPGLRRGRCLGQSRRAAVHDAAAGPARRALRVLGPRPRTTTTHAAEMAPESVRGAIACRTHPTDFRHQLLLPRHPPGPIPVNPANPHSTSAGHGIAHDPRYEMPRCFRGRNHTERNGSRRDLGGATGSSRPTAARHSFDVRQ